MPINPYLCNQQADDTKTWLQRWEWAQQHPWPFFYWFVNTKDPHEAKPQLAISKPFPRKALYRVLCRVYLDCPVLFMEKARQILASWFTVGFLLWWALTRTAQMIQMQGEKEEKTKKLMERCQHIYGELVKWGLPDLPKAKMTGERHGTSKKLVFPSIKSEIEIIPQGKDQVRSETVSKFYSDESEFQPDFGEILGAVGPALLGGGGYISTSSVNGHNEVEDNVYGYDARSKRVVGPNLVDSREVQKELFSLSPDLSEESRRRTVEQVLMAMPQDEFDSMPLHELVAATPGLNYWITYNGTNSVIVDFLADPDKDPITEVGKRYVDQLPTIMPSQRRREREMYRNRAAYEGKPVISNWEYNRFVRTGLPYDHTVALRLSFDFGTELCGTPVAQLIPRIIDGKRCKQLLILAEIILQNSNTPELGESTIKLIQRRFPRSWETNNIESCCDPAGHQKRETTSDKSRETSIRILEEMGFYPDSRKFGVFDTTELLETVFSAELPNGEPLILIDSSCEYFISCFAGGLHYPTKGRPGYYEKDGYYDHGGDMCRYLFANCFEEYDLAEPQQAPKPEPQLIRRRYTGEVIGTKRKIPTVEERFGGHTYRSRVRG